MPVRDSEIGSYVHPAPPWVSTTATFGLLPLAITTMVVSATVIFINAGSNKNLYTFIAVQLALTDFLIACGPMCILVSLVNGRLEGVYTETDNLVCLTAAVFCFTTTDISVCMLLLYVLAIYHRIYYINLSWYHAQINKKKVQMSSHLVFLVIALLNIYLLGAKPGYFTDYCHSRLPASMHGHTGFILFILGLVWLGLFLCGFPIFRDRHFAFPGFQNSKAVSSSEESRAFSDVLKSSQLKPFESHKYLKVPLRFQKLKLDDILEEDTTDNKSGVKAERDMSVGESERVWAKSLDRHQMDDHSVKISALSRESDSSSVKQSQEQKKRKKWWSSAAESHRLLLSSLWEASSFSRDDKSSDTMESIRSNFLVNLLDTFEGRSRVDGFFITGGLADRNSDLDNFENMKPGMKPYPANHPSINTDTSSDSPASEARPSSARGGITSHPVDNNWQEKLSWPGVVNADDFLPSAEERRRGSVEDGSFPSLSTYDTQSSTHVSQMPFHTSPPASFSKLEGSKELAELSDLVPPLTPRADTKSGQAQSVAGNGSHTDISRQQPADDAQDMSDRSSRSTQTNLRELSRARLSRSSHSGSGRRRSSASKGSRRLVTDQRAVGNGAGVEAGVGETVAHERVKNASESDVPKPLAPRTTEDQEERQTGPGSTQECEGDTANSAPFCSDIGSNEQHSSLPGIGARETRNKHRLVKQPTVAAAVAVAGGYVSARTDRGAGGRQREDDSVMLSTHKQPRQATPVSSSWEIIRLKRRERHARLIAQAKARRQTTTTSSRASEKSREVKLQQDPSSDSSRDSRVLLRTTGSVGSSSSAKGGNNGEVGSVWGLGGCGKKGYLSRLALLTKPGLPVSEKGRGVFWYLVVLVTLHTALWLPLLLFMQLVDSGSQVFLEMPHSLLLLLAWTRPLVGSSLLLWFSQHEL